jgi:hypothetical protein
VTGATIDVDISGLAVRFEGLSDPLASELGRRWREYVSAAPLQPALVIRVEDDERVMTPSRFMDGALHIEGSSDEVRFRRDEGRIVQDIRGTRAVVRLAQGDERRRFWGLVNLACAAVGWTLLGRGGGAVHAAGAILDGRAYLVVGPSGCGKTTWARTAAEAGLPVLSDDCVLVDVEDGRLSALGSPFRSTEFPAPGRGRWPVAAILIPQPAPEAGLAPVARLMLEARIAANLLFATAAREAPAVAARAVESIAAGAAARTLSFRPDSSWIDVLREIEADRNPE